MKNKLSLLAIIAIAFASCSKDENTLTSTSEPSANRYSNPVTPVIGAVPSSFTHKVLLENVTGTTYGKCPTNDYNIGGAITQYPSQVIAVSFHKSDAMETASTSGLVNFVSNGTMPQIPAMMMNRNTYTGKIFNEDGTWTSNLSAALSGMAPCGVAIQSTFQPNKLIVTVHAGFNMTLPGKYNLVAYLAENNVKKTGSGYDQANTSNTDSGSPFYNLGDPIVNYNHNYVFRNTVTSMSGVSIPASYRVAGGHMIQTFIIDVPPTIKINDAFIVAYIYNTADLQILNSQSAKVSTVQSWD
jgi:hypothetical protein